MAEYKLSQQSIEVIERALSKGNEVKLSAWNNKIKVMSIRTKLEHIQAPDKM
ncbi:hypothetical protein [Flavonifractor plautii]|uniref:hypothetical protein n=1 Tax=Flavonifractor plautii TaxID=292800 RepID=UPI0013994765|nr:hypothetical protein [Flavonifractor plautii]QIA31955.1 hypothetical protein GXM20_16010 [Flavonifractor plautii]